MLGRARASLLKIEALIPELERQMEAEPARPDPARRPAPVESVSLEGVTFSYRDPADDRGFALGPLDLTLRRGEIVVLAGGNGSGKTTLVKVALGPLPSRVGRRPARRPRGRGRRGRVAPPALLGRLRRRPPVRRPARPRLRRDRRAGAATGSSGWGWRPGLGERRAASPRSTCRRASGGGWRLLSAWLEDRPFCILDEWAANQDPAFKRIFYARLLPEMRAAGKGLLVISHDEEYFDVADRVIRLREGRVFEESPLGVGVWTVRGIRP